MTYAREQQIAIEAVSRAAALCVAVQAELVKVGSLEKGDRSPVTIADFGSQALVCRHLRAHFPDDPIVGEEDSAQLQQPEHADWLAKVTDFVRRFAADATPESVCQWIDAGNGAVANRFWTLDPIDGTKGFLRDDQYAVALALIEDGEVKVAALACPSLPLSLDDPASPVGALFCAVRGEGAQMAALESTEFTPIQVAPASDRARVRFAESVEAKHGDLPLQQQIAAAVGITTPPLQMDSQAKYGVVARGDAALYLRLPVDPNYVEKIWDHAAGSLIVEEAGGQVTDMRGQPLNFAASYKLIHNQGVIVSNGELHETVLQALAGAESE